MSLLRSNPVVVSRVPPCPKGASWRTIRAGEHIPSGHRAIYASGESAYLFNGAEGSAHRLIGITDGGEVPPGAVITYMPPGGTIDPSLVSLSGTLWAAASGQLVDYAGISAGEFTRRVAIGIPTQSICVDFGEIIQKKE